MAMSFHGHGSEVGSILHRKAEEEGFQDAATVESLSEKLKAS